MVTFDSDQKLGTTVRMAFYADQSSTKQHQSADEIGL